MPRFIRAALVAAACGLAAPAHADTKLTVLLDWFVNPDHAPLIVAEARGAFAEAGLAVEFVEPADPAMPPRLVAAGEGDIAVTYQPSLYQQVSEGLPVARIGTLVSSPLNSLVTLADGPVETLSDLKGKTVGYSVGGFEDALLGRMLASEGMSLEDVTLVNVNFALTPALLSGRVDAVIGAFRNFELTQIELENREGRAFLPEEHGVPTYEELIYIAANDRLDDPALAAFLTVVADTTTWMRANRDEAERLFFEATPAIDDTLNRRAFADTFEKFADDPKALDTERYEAFAAFMTEAGLVSDLPALGAYAVEIE